MEPERREIVYVLLNREDLEKEIHPSEDEINRYYEDNAARFTREKQVRAQHILLRVKPDAPQAEVDNIRAQAQKILDEARKGKDFAELAKKYSQDEATAKKGGELGFFSSKQMDPGLFGGCFCPAAGRDKRACANSIWVPHNQVGGNNRGEDRPYRGGER